MNGVNKTLYIPLYGKAYVSRKGILLRDEMAERIWAAEGFPLKGKAKAKWLAYSMGMRAAVYDRWTEGLLRQHPESAVLHLGCGMDSRCSRVSWEKEWYDVDFPEVIRERKRYYPETEGYRMVPGDLRERNWLEEIPRGTEAIVVMEGVSMYLSSEELQRLLRSLGARFSRVRLLMDVYTVLGAKATKYKNPINTVGVTHVFGVDSGEAAAAGTGLRFLRERDMTPEDMILELPKGERGIFRRVFAGNTARKFCRMYEFERE